MFRKNVSLLLAAVLLMSFLAGCASKSGGTNTPESPAPQTPAPKEKVIRYNMGADPRSLDPAIMTDLAAFSAENQLFEGLVRITEKGVVPGMAASWEEKDGGLKYVFTLRDGLKWSNGDPITAEDFVYAWQRALDPRTGAEYAYQLYYIKGAEALNSVEADKADAITAAMSDLGAKALDSKTIEVTLVAPTPYFVDLTAFPTLHPVNKKVASANAEWASKAESYISNGPFRLVKWEPNSELVMEKNPNYWDAATVKVDKLIYYMVAEKATALNMWETDQVDIIESPPPAELARLRQEGKLKTAPSYGTYYYLVNNKVKPFDDPKVRKALAMAIDRKAIVDNVTRGGQKPAYALIAPGSPDPIAGKDFREVGGDLFKEDVAEAKRLLAEAGYPDGNGFPEVTFLYNTDETHKAVGEAIMEMWKKNLGITVSMQNTEWKVVLDRRHHGDYQIARAGWYGDYLDAMTYMDLYMTKSGNNDAFYSNAEYDRLVDEAKKTSDQKVRFANMHKAEQLIIEEMGLLPLYYYVSLYLEKENITGVYRNALGIMDLKTADVK